MAGLRALFEIDIKKIVALSTLRQLGLMATCLGLGFFKVRFFHLLTHAYFKALLFIGVGNLIHQSNSFQDLRKISISCTNLQVSFSYITLANISLCGLPFMAGFFSKDLFLELSIMNTVNPIMLATFFVATALTASYTIRFFLIVNSAVFRRERLRWTSDQDVPTILGISSLRALAVTGGAFLVVSLPDKRVIFLPTEIKNFTLIIILFGIARGRLFAKLVKNNETSSSLGNMWCLPVISAPSFSTNRLHLSSQISTLRDKLWLEKYHVSGLRGSSIFQLKKIFSVFLNLGGGFTVLLLVLIWLIYLHFLI